MTKNRQKKGLKIESIKESIKNQNTKTKLSFFEILINKDNLKQKRNTTHNSALLQLGVSI